MNESNTQRHKEIIARNKKDRKTKKRRKTERRNTNYKHIPKGRLTGGRTNGTQDEPRSVTNKEHK